MLKSAYYLESIDQIIIKSVIYTLMIAKFNTRKNIEIGLQLRSDGSSSINYVFTCLLNDERTHMFSLYWFVRTTKNFNYTTKL